MNYRLKIIEELGGKCMYIDQETELGCSMKWDNQPIDNVDMLHVEHVNGKGNEERLKFSNRRYSASSYSSSPNWITGGGQKYYQYILDNLHTGQYQLLCANHHALKTADERRQRKQAQALAKGQERPEPDTNYENSQNTTASQQLYSPDMVNIRYDTTVEELEQLYQSIACSIQDINKHTAEYSA